LHSAYEKDRQFRDTQESGPFAHWEHTHQFEPVDDRQCTLHDTIRFEPPAGKLGNMLAGTTLDRMLQRMFDYRHETTSQDLAMHEKYQGAELKRVAITGATGMVGEALSSYLSAGGIECLPISRKSGKQYITWDPLAGSIDKERLEGVDAVVHLA